MRGETTIRAHMSSLLQFQFTPLMRGETRRICCALFRRRHFNPLPSCEGRPCPAPVYFSSTFISIHSPHARGDTATAPKRAEKEKFQSTPLMRGETVIDKGRYGRGYISIHSPHARGDEKTFNLRKLANISIHSPHARGDMLNEADIGYTQISIHSPHARGDIETGGSPE